MTPGMTVRGVFADWFPDSAGPLWIGHFSPQEWRQHNKCSQKEQKPANNAAPVADSIPSPLRFAGNLGSCLCASRLPIESGDFIAAPTLRSIDVLIQSQLAGGPPMPLDIQSKSSQPGFGPHIPAVFTALEEAQNSLYYYQNRCLKAAYDLDDVAVRGNPVSLLEEGAYLESYSQSRDVFRGILRKWFSAFEAFLSKTGATMDSKALQGAAVLKISHRISLLQVEYHKQNKLQSPNTWDPLLRECEEIVDLATSVVKLHNGTSSNTKSKGPVFFMDMNIVGPLFSIAHRCRDPIIRRRAIALLYSTPRQEGLWHSVITARVAEKIMNVEEAGLGEVKSCKDVPEENRISDIDLQFDLQGRKGYLKFSRRLRTGQHIYVAEPILEVFEELIEW